MAQAGLGLSSHFLPLYENKRVKWVKLWWKMFIGLVNGGLVYSPVQDSSLDRGETVFRRYGHFRCSCGTMQLCKIGLNFKTNINEEKKKYTFVTSKVPHGISLVA